MKSLSIFSFCLVFTATAFLLQISPAGATDLAYGCVRITNVDPGDSLWIRQCPQRTCDKVGKFADDDTNIRTGDCEGKWCQVRKGDISGWSHNGYLESDPGCGGNAGALEKLETEDQIVELFAGMTIAKKGRCLYFGALANGAGTLYEINSDGEHIERMWIASIGQIDILHTNKYSMAALIASSTYAVERNGKKIILTRIPKNTSVEGPPILGERFEGEHFGQGARCD